MFHTDINVCNERMREEQNLANAAPSDEAAMVHLQMVMLFKSQLSMLNRRLVRQKLNSHSCR
jgi:hypothetical protein